MGGRGGKERNVVIGVVFCQGVQSRISINERLKGPSQGACDIESLIKGTPIQVCTKKVIVLSRVVKERNRRGKQKHTGVETHYH